MNFPSWITIDISQLGAAGVAVLTLFAIVVVLFAIAILHHMITDRERRKNRERFERASIALASHFVSNSPKLDEAVDRARRTEGDRAVALVLRRARYDLDSQVCDRITVILQRVGEIDSLVKESASRRDWKRTLGVRGLGECGGAKALKVLLTAADDESSEVRRAARDGLLANGSPQAVHTAIRSFIRDLPRRAGWRRSFYARLAVSAAQELTELIRSGELSSGEEKLAIEALGDAGRPAALKLALERVASEDAESRGTAMRVIGKVGTERELTLLYEGLKDKEWFVRAAAARAVEWLLALKQVRETSPVHQVAARELGNTLGDTSWWVRANAARALSRLGPAGVKVLLQNVDSKDRYARDAAIAAVSMTSLGTDARLTIRKKVEAMLESTSPKLSIGGQNAAQSAVTSLIVR